MQIFPKVESPLMSKCYKIGDACAPSSSPAALHRSAGSDRNPASATAVVNEQLDSGSSWAFGLPSGKGVLLPHRT